MRETSLTSLTTLGAITLLALGCGRHQRTIVLPASTNAPVTSAPTSGTPTPSTPLSPPAVGLPAPVASGAVSAPPAIAPLAADLALASRGATSIRVAADATEVSAFALSVANVSSGSARLDTLRLRAEGSLDDVRDLRTLLLAEDVDGDRRFDRALDRPLSSGGFLQDNGTVELAINVTLAPGQSLDLVVALDLSGSARANDTLRLALDPSVAGGALSATSQGGARIALHREAGTTLRVGAWTEPGLELSTPGDGLFPRAVRDAQGRTHVAIYQNHSGSSDVWYSLFDGRDYSRVYDVSHSPQTSWNPDLAIDAQGVPLLVWEAWDPAVNDYAVRFSRFDSARFEWTPTEDVSRGAGLSPRIALHNNEVHVVWAERGAVTAIKHAVRTAQGWSSVAEISSAAPSARVEGPHLALDANGQLFCAWAENDFGQSSIQGRALLSGRRYGGREVVARVPQQVRAPFLLQANGSLYAAYAWGGDLYVAQKSSSGWLPGVNVSQTTGSARNPWLTWHAGALHVFWIQDESNGGPTAHQIAHASQRGGGFGPVELLTRGVGARDWVTAVSEGDRLKVLWQDWSLGRQRIFGCWQDASLFESPRTVTQPGAEATLLRGARAADGALALAYALESGGNNEVFVQVAAGADGVFAPAENVSRSADPSMRPALASISSRSLWAAWEEQTTRGFEVRVAVRSPLGWSSAATLSSGTPAYAPDLSAWRDGAGTERLSAAWSERLASGQQALLLSELGPSGWSAGQAIATRGDVWSPSLAHDAQGRVLCVFEHEESGRREVALYEPSRGVAPVASSIQGQYAPRVAVLGDEVFVAWVEDGSVLVARRAPGASAFDPPERLTLSGAWSIDVATSGDRVLVTWEQWSGSSVRPTCAVREQGAWGAPEPLDFSAEQGRRTHAVGAGGGAFDVFWTEPHGVIQRHRRGS